MSAQISARPCGPGSLKRWVRGSVSLLEKLGLEWWLASGVVFLVAAWVAGQWLAMLPAMVAWGAVVGRGLWGVAGVLVAHPIPTVSDQWRAWTASNLGVLVTVSALLSGVCLLFPQWVLPDGAPMRLEGPHFAGWPVFAWCAWLARPWGPLGFIGPLVRKGCPPLHAFRLQALAFRENTLALLGLGAIWVLGLVLVLVVPVVGLLTLFVWPFLLRCAFEDIFEGGLSVAQRARAPSSVPSVSAPS